MPEALFTKRDGNQDGVLSLDEMPMAHEHGKARGKDKHKAKDRGEQGEARAEKAKMKGCLGAASKALRDRPAL